MSEDEMLDCFDGDIAPYRPEPNIPDSGDLLGAWSGTFETVLDPLAPEVFCVKDIGELTSQGVDASHIFFNPLTNPENPEYDPSNTDRYCTVVIRGANGEMYFPTMESREERDAFCRMFDPEECVQPSCEVQTQSLNGQLVDVCVPRE